MTLPLFLVEPAVVANATVGSRVVLDGAEGRHAATVRRIQEFSYDLPEGEFYLLLSYVNESLDAHALTLAVGRDAWLATRAQAA